MWIGGLDPRDFASQARFNREHITPRAVHAAGGKSFIPFFPPLFLNFRQEKRKHLMLETFWLWQWVLMVPLRWRPIFRVSIRWWMYWMEVSLFRVFSSSYFLLLDTFPFKKNSNFFPIKKKRCDNLLNSFFLFLLSPTPCFVLICFFWGGGAIDWLVSLTSWKTNPCDRQIV